MRRITSFIVFMFMGCSLFAGSINWFSSYEKALETAEKENKNIFVLITAPSWCYWCTELEKNVLEKKVFQKNLAEDYIPLMLLDEVNGQRNPELERFDFSGYPTVMVYDSEGNYIEDIYTQDPDEMIESMDLFKNIVYSKLVLPEQFISEEQVFVNNHDGTWTEKNSSEEYIHTQAYYDLSYLFLIHENEDSIIALPLRETEAYIGYELAEEMIWDLLPEMTKVGGDDFFAM